MAQYKLDMFKELLPALDRHDLDFYSQLDEDQQKGFQGLVAMRFMSSSRGATADWYLMATNLRANVHFFEMYDHPELQYKLLAANGLGKVARHEWIAGAKKINDGPLAEFIMRFWPQANTIEVEVILGQFDRASFSDFVDGTGVDSNEAKRIKKIFEERRL